RTAALSLSWPKAAGTIMRSTVRAARSQGGENTGSTTTYRPDIAYSYSVNEKAYTGQRVRAGSAYVRTQKAAEAILEPYPVGRSVEVAYAPARPEMAMLDPGSTAGTDTMHPRHLFSRLRGRDGGHRPLHGLTGLIDDNRVGNPGALLSTKFTRISGMRVF